MLAVFFLAVTSCEVYVTFAVGQSSSISRFSVVSQRAVLLDGPSSRYQGRGTKRAEWETCLCVCLAVVLTCWRDTMTGENSCRRKLIAKGTTHKLKFPMS